VLLGLATAIILSSVLLSFDYIGIEATFMLVVFNFLLAPLTFALEGPVRMKILLLLLGNLVGLLWNGLFSSFVSALVSGRAELLTVFYLIVSPFMNLLWIVTFYSVSLTILARSQAG
jgi:hypothetical protein